MKRIMFYPLRYRDNIVPPQTKVSTITATYCGGGFPPGCNLRAMIIECSEI